MVRRLTSSHVKTRRLYYLYKLAEVLETSGPMREKRLIIAIKEWALNNRNFLTSYVDATGEISSEDAGKRYLTFSRQLDLVSLVGKELVNTVFGSVLSKLNVPDKQAYRLCCGLSCFLLKRLLDCDFDYLITIARMLKNDETSFNSFKNRLEEHLRRSSPSGIPIQGIKLLKQMENWKSPEKFFKENILAPRKAWFIDLELVDWRKFKSTSKIEFKDQAMKFLLKIGNLQQKELHAFLENEYFSEFAQLVANGTEFKDFSHLTRENRMKKTINYLQRAFSLFSINQLNRISSRSFFEYTLCHALCQEKIVCTRRDLEKVLFEISTSNAIPYRYRKVEEISSTGVRTEAGYISGET